MKKTVIKRRKRVSAAGAGGGNVSGRMSDQAAAEALVAVGRLGVSPGEAGNDESDEADQPKKKRTRRGAKPPGSGTTDKDDDVVMDGEDEEDARESAQQMQRDTRKRRGVNGWAESGRSSSPQHRAPPRNQDYSRTGGGGSGGLPTFPGSGFELPPLAALNNGAPFLGNASAPPSSYIRSGSNAPSRTHSPLGPAGSGSGTGYVLPPPHGLSQYYPSTPPADMSTLMVAAGVALGGLGIPSYMDLERHYVELTEQKRKWEEMMERTDRLMAGVKRTLDEMRGLVAQQTTPPPSQSLQQQSQQSQQQPSSAPATAAGTPKQPPQPSTASSSPHLQPIEDATVVPAVPPNRGGSSGERERNVIWSIVDATSSVHD
jgi:GATA-binding protein